MKAGGRLLPLFALCLAALGQITINHEVSLAPPLPVLILYGDVSEKAWPRQLPLNKKGFTPKSHSASLLHVVEARL